MMESENGYQMSPRKSRGNSRGGVTVLIILLLIAIAGFAWSYYQYSKAQQELTALTDPNVKNELDAAQSKALLARVGKLIELPEGEDPVIAAISDVESLAHEQNFYKDAKNGQKLIVYYGAQKAIIYDEQENILVNVGPVFLKDANGVDQPAPRVEGKLTLEIRNGSKDANKGVTVRDNLLSDSIFNLIRMSKAINRDYGDPIVVNLIGDGKPELIKKLEEAMGVTAVRELPAGEAPTNAEVMVIVGNNDK